MKRTTRIHPPGGPIRVCLKLAACLVGCSVLVGSAGAAPPKGSAPAASPSLFGEQIDVRVVNIEVVATDKAGERVSGLRPGDLRLKIDGKPAPIEFFTEVRGGVAIAPPEKDGEPAVQGLPSLAPGSPVGTSYLVFIDDYFSLNVRRNEVLRALKADLASLGPEDRMAIVAYDGRKLDMLSSWSQDTRQLGRILDQAMDRHSRGIDRTVERHSFRDARGFDRPNVSGRGLGLSGQLGTEERAYADVLENQVQQAVDAAASTLRGFAAPPGRKVMLLLSGGWPYDIGEYVVNDVRRSLLSHDVPAGEVMYRPLVDTANRLGYTIYPVDVAGVTNLSESAEQIQATLLYTAEQTGGKAQLAGLRTAALKNAAADTRSYYWLGFTPSFKGNDKHHKIEVESVRPGLKVRARNDFLDMSRQSEVSYQVESAMLFGSPIGAPGLLVEVGKAKKTKHSEMAVPVTLAIPVAAVTPVAQQGEYVTELEVRVAARDVHGDRSDVPVVPVRFTTKTAPAAGHFFKYQTTLELRRIQQHVMLAVFDPLGNKVSTVETDVAAP